MTEAATYYHELLMVRAENERLRKLLTRTVEELSIMDESRGVVGWHLDGSVASWNEFALPELRAEIIATLKEATE